MKNDYRANRLIHTVNTLDRDEFYDVVTDGEE